MNGPIRDRNRSGRATDTFAHPANRTAGGWHHVTRGSPDTVPQYGVLAHEAAGISDVN